MKYIPENIEKYDWVDATISFISVINSGTDFEQLICDAYNSSHINDEDFTERTKEYLKENDILDYYSEEIKEDFIMHCNINFSDQDYFINEDFSSSETFVDRFTTYMTSHTIYTWIFADDMYRLNMRFLYREIYYLEMQLREVLSYIYIKEFYPDLENFHKHLKEQPKWKKEWEDFNNVIKESWKVWENVFFRFTFSDYRRILETKEPNIKDLITLIQTNDSLEGIRESLSSNIIKNENHIEFLASITDSLESIEKVRNAIMHFRKPSQTELNNYEIAKKKLEDKIDLFPYWYYAEYELPLEEWKEYELRLPFRDFEVWKKYKLKSRNWYEAIFLLEDWTEEYMVDKDVEEHFKIW